MDRRFSCMAAVACLCLLGCNDNRNPSSSTNTSDSGNPLHAPADYVGAAVNAQKSAQKTVGLLGVDQAIKAFFAEEGRYPRSLDELKANGVPVPAPPAGMKWEYNPDTGAIKAVPQ